MLNLYPPSPDDPAPPPAKVGALKPSAAPLTPLKLAKDERELILFVRRLRFVTASSAVEALKRLEHEEYKRARQVCWNNVVRRGGSPETMAERMNAGGYALDDYSPWTAEAVRFQLESDGEARPAQKAKRSR